MAKRIAIVGGGIAGLAAAYELTVQRRAGADLSFTLFEASSRLGGIVDTGRVEGFVLEGGPDGWVSEKPWARELAIELGLEPELIFSNDDERVTYILKHGKLQPMPDGMRMMVPTDLHALEGSALFSEEARRHYREEPQRAAELKQNAPQHDETVANFVERHFGTEVLNVIGAPLLNGVFGGDVHKLSVQAVMLPFVQMEREHGSLILALQQRARERGPKKPPPIFTSLRGGTASLVDAIANELSRADIAMGKRIHSLERVDEEWNLRFAPVATVAGTAEAIGHRIEAERFDAIVLALPVHETQRLLNDLDSSLMPLLDISGSSALTIAFAFGSESAPVLPKGFGFLAPPGEGVRMLAATFSDQKFADRAPVGTHNVRVYYGGEAADDLHASNVAEFAREELQRVIGPVPPPLHARVRYWPQALPQYHVGHVKRMAELDARIAQLGNVYLLGNGYRGVGLPDLVRDARSTARHLAQR